MLVREYPDSRNQESQGTCFLVSPDGIAVTSHHVVDGAKEISVTLADGKRVPAVINSKSAANDIAILSLNASTPDYLSLAKTKSAQLGDEIFTMGFPSRFILGSDPKFTEGSISALSGLQGDVSYLQISVPIQPGSSGGPVVNHQGHVVGIIASTARFQSFYQATGSLPQNVNWAVKSDYVKLMMNDLPPRAAASSRNEAITRVQKAVCQVVASP
jgi:S1-C subfamily serine protease